MSTVINGTTGINRVEPTAYGLPLSHRNKIINGKMEIAQRGTSFPAMASGYYSLDRWRFDSISNAVITVSQQADVPANSEFQSCLRTAVTTADTSIAAGEIAGLLQIIEGYNSRDLVGKSFTLSFWVRSSKTGVHCVKFGNAGADRSYVVEYIIDVANTWEHKTVTVAGGLITAGTWNWTNGVGMSVVFALAAGSNFQTSPNAWQTGNFSATSNQVNCLDTIGNIFAITGVQLEAGPVATPFEHRPYGIELAMCQRYYEIIAGPHYYGYVGTVGNSTTVYAQQTFATRKRAAPTVAVVGGLLGQALWSSSGSDLAAATVAVRISSVDSFSVQYLAASAIGGIKSSNEGGLIFGASAEL